MFGAKPLPEPRMTYNQPNHKEQFLMKFYSIWKAFIQENVHLQNGTHFCPTSMCQHIVKRTWFMSKIVLLLHVIFETQSKIVICSSYKHVYK